MTSLNVWGEMLRKWNVFYFPERLNVTSTAFTETACIAKLTSKCQKFRISVILTTNCVTEDLITVKFVIRDSK